VLLFPDHTAQSVETLVREMRRSASASRGDSSGSAERLAPDETAEKTSEDFLKTNAERPDRGRGAAAVLAALDAVVIIDSKWDGADVIGRSDSCKNLPRAKLEKYRTAFWRFHTKKSPKGLRVRRSERRERGETESAENDDEMLCSLEALFFFIRELHECGFTGSADERGDDDRARANVSAERTASTWEGPETSSARFEPRRCDAILGTGPCHCHDDLFWYFAYQHSVVAKGAATREYDPVPPQARRRGRAARRTERRTLAAEGKGGPPGPPG
jgi:hypothetical protein